MRRAQGKLFSGLALAVGLLGFSACFFLPSSEDSEPGGDRRAPEAVITSPADGFATDLPSVVVTGTASDRHTITSVMVYGCVEEPSRDRSDPCYPGSLMAGTKTGRIKTAVSAVSLAENFGRWQAEVKFFLKGNVTQELTLRVGTMDDQGNFNLAADSIRGTVDFSGPDLYGPELEIIVPQEGQVIGANLVPVVGTAEDRNQIVSITVDPGSGPIAAESYTGLPGDLELWRAEVPLAPGANTLTITAADDQVPANTTVAVVNLTRDAKGNMVFITTPSPFTMGNNQGSPAEQPEHLVRLSDYYLDLYETSLADYLLCYYLWDDPADAGSHHCPLIGSEDVVLEDVLLPAGSPRNPYPWDIVDTLAYPLTGRAKYPARNIDPFSAEWFCNWNGGKRLPTEAEWERAARAGVGVNNEPDGRLNPLGGDMVDCATANVVGCVGRVLAVDDPVYGPNPLGIYHLAGNVMEWVQDYYQVDYYSVLKPLEPVLNPVMNVEADSTCLYGSWACLVNRGGAYTSSAQVARSTFRNYYDDPWQIGMDFMIGFRCAADGP